MKSTALPALVGFLVAPVYRDLPGMIDHATGTSLRSSR
jgi:hypothetical protein